MESKRHIPQPGKGQGAEIRREADAHEVNQPPRDARASDAGAGARPEARQDAPLGTGDAILAAARSLALDIGFRRSTIVDVARRAGVSRMTVYREYEDLGSIWSELLTQELVGLIDDVSEDLADLDARGRIARAAGTLVVGISSHPLFRRALDVDPELLLPLVVDRFGASQQAALQQTEALLAVGVLDGSIAAERATPGAACAILLTVQSFIFSARVIESRSDAEAVRAELGVLLDRYLAP